MTKEVYDNAVNVLLDAYNNETLEHENCYACAVGNLVADANNYKLIETDDIVIKFKWDNDTSPDWANSAMDRVGKKGRLDWYLGESKRQIDSTGMSIEELVKIECAFEGVFVYMDFNRDNLSKRNQFNGLCEVLKVMETMVEEEVSHKENMDKLETIKNKFVCT